MENYEEKYKNAVHKMKVLLERSKENGWMQILAFDDDFEQIFPELVESEDEKIKKVLTNYFKHYQEYGGDTFDGISSATILAWLEKQGEQKSFDRVEPKFKVGDWVAANPSASVIHSPLKIVDVSDIEYRIEDIEGSSGVPIIEVINRNYHLWTIQDAKDGDVLVSRSSFIYGKQYPYGGLNWSNNNFIIASNFIFTDSPVHPATKEQRNLLFQKMREAGYEWDADKKELRRNKLN